MRREQRAQSDLPPPRVLLFAGALACAALLLVFRPSVPGQAADEALASRSRDDDELLQHQPRPGGAPAAEAPQPLGGSEAEEQGGAEALQQPATGDSAGACGPVALELADGAQGTFTASLCWSAGDCAGTLRIARVRCSGTDWHRNLSNDAEHDRWIRSNLGPDTWRVRVAGAEVLMPTVRFRGGCAYEAALRVGSAGDYSVAVELLYQNFDALDEVRNVWPPMLKRPLLRLGPAAEAARRTLYHQGQLTPPSEVSLRCAASRPRPPPSGLPRCGAAPAADASVGRWRRTGSGKQLLTKVRVKKLQRQPVVFQWSLQGENEHAWVPDSCALPPLDVTSARRCLAKRRVVVGGDSQQRAFYFGLLNFLRGHGDRCVRNISAPDHKGEALFNGDPRCVENTKGSHKHLIGDIQLDFLEDAYIDKGCRPGGKYGRYDIVVLGFAQHPASRVHWPLARYQRALSERAACVRGLVSRGRRVLWLLAPKYPDTKEGYPVGVKDWRTDPRLELFNKRARAAIAPLGVPIVDMFALTAPMGHASSDQAHYNNWVLHEVLSVAVAALCGGRSE
eukprot:TRINITY_DN29395_c0_g1_i1.p1 TRINITY_DN29395_c0_g1~~TRINITY_DN29395_c0_g1_i1.p1  ORF type:complete len:564 (+),score=154.08 TRINITY_DN29395_c0_g1_i1:128-1819(+)